MNTVQKHCYPGKELEAMSFAVNYHQWIVDEISPFLGRTTVEVGAGVGDFSRMLLRTSIERLYAFEPSINLFGALEERLESHSAVKTVNDFLGNHQLSGEIDSVLYINVMEHIEDDRRELRTAWTVVRPGGHLLLFVPALSWLFSDVDRQVGHFRRYLKKDLERKVGEAGFEVVRSRYFDFAGILPWYVNFVLLRRSLDASSVSLYDRLVVPPMRWAERYIRPPVGKNILLVARKQEE